MNITVRQMNTDDLPAVAAIEAACYTDPWSEKGFADALVMPGSVLLAAECLTDRKEAFDSPAGKAPDADSKERVPAGYIGMYTAADEGEIIKVTVSHAFRRKGVGTALISALIREAAKRGIRNIYLEVRISNTAAAALYEKAGFAHCGIRKGFYDWPKEDAYVMCLKMNEETNTVRMEDCDD